MSPISPINLLEACAVVMVGATLHGSVGFGIGALAAPFLMLIDPGLVPGPLLFAAIGLTVLLARRERSSIDFTGMSWAVAGRVPGTVLGAAALALVPSGQMSLMFGAVVLLAVGMSAFGLRVRRTNWSLLGAGAMSGFMSTTASIGGPPMAILYHDTPGARVRGTLSSFFVVGATFSLVALVAVGRFGWGELVAAVSLLPGILLGFAVSSHTARLVDRGYTRKAVLAVSALAGLSVILRELV